MLSHMLSSFIRLPSMHDFICCRSSVSVAGELARRRTRIPFVSTQRKFASCTAFSHGNKSGKTRITTVREPTTTKTAIGTSQALTVLRDAVHGVLYFAKRVAPNQPKIHLLIELLEPFVLRIQANSLAALLSIGTLCARHDCMQNGVEVLMRVRYLLIELITGSFKRAPELL